jgi:integrase
MLLSLAKEILPPITSAGFAAGGSVLDHRFGKGDAYTLGVEDEYMLLRPIAARCALAGLRVSETLGLTWADVDFNARTITVRRQLRTNGNLVPTKTISSSAPVSLLPALERELRTHRTRQRETRSAVRASRRSGIQHHPWESGVPTKRAPRPFSTQATRWV